MSTQPTIINPFNFRPPLQGAIVDSTGAPTSQERIFRTNLQLILASMSNVDVKDFGARGNGTSDDTQAIQTAINQAIQNGGGVVNFPPGTYPVNLVSIPASAPPIILYGQGASSIIKRNGTVQSGHGFIDIYASNLLIENLTIDGATMTPAGLQYGSWSGPVGGVNDPYSTTLTNNTSVWIHGGCTNVSFYMCLFQHAAGYSILVDGTQTTVSGTYIERCQFKNNRPFLFGTSPTDLNYGSWCGGIFAKGDGRTVGSSVVSGLVVTQCQFERNDGNCLWSHNWGLNAVNEDFRFTNNYFIDCGLDAILMGVVTNGIVSNNVFRRVGYVTYTDTDLSAPKWLVYYNATALDSAGLVVNVPYVCNSFLDINGGCIDLDSHGQSVITGNVMRIASAGDPEYAEDRVAISGYSNNGSTSYGVNCNNSSMTNLGDTNLSIVGNTFVGLPAGSVRLYATRYALVSGNLIAAPSTVINPPIQMGPTGTNADQRCYGNKICHNQIIYNPGSALPVVEEDNTVAFLGTESNSVFGNVPIQPSGSIAVEFSKSATSGSTVYAETVWFP